MSNCYTRDVDNGGNIYMVGIGGIGMSALAQLFVHQKRIVTGSDREESPVTKLLGEKGITVLIGQKKENVPIDAELIVYSDAVPPDNPERQRAKDMGIPQISYYEALGEISKNTPTIADLQTTFRKAVEKVPPNGCIVADPTNQHVAEVLSHSKAPIIDYTTQTVPRLQVIGDFNIENAQAAKAAARTAFPHLQESYTDRALLDFKGSWRRFEYKGKTRQGALVYDDYAHHPTAIAKTIAAAREEFPGKKIVVAFHPHLYSRTRDLMDDFARSLALADEIVLAPIYAARENPITGVTSDVLANKIKNIGTAAESFSSLPEVFKYLNENLDLQADSLLITIGAGDIYKVAEQ